MHKNKKNEREKKTPTETHLSFPIRLYFICVRLNVVTKLLMTYRAWNIMLFGWFSWMCSVATFHSRQLLPSQMYTTFDIECSWTKKEKEKNKHRREQGKSFSQTLSLLPCLPHTMLVFKNFDSVHEVMAQHYFTRRERWRFRYIIA